MNDIQYYAKKLVSLRVDKARNVSPHKPCLMLAVIDLYDTDPGRENRIYFDPTLIERYLQYFSVVGRDNQHPNPHLPFSRLWGDGFWHLMSNSDGARIDHRVVITSSSKLREAVSYAELDGELHNLLKHEENRTLLAQTLVNHWFDRDQDEMGRLVGTSHQINLYERRLRSTAPAQMVREANPRHSYVILRSGAWC